MRLLTTSSTQPGAQQHSAALPAKKTPFFYRWDLRIPKRCTQLQRCNSSSTDSVSQQRSCAPSFPYRKHLTHFPQHLQAMPAFSAHSALHTSNETSWQLLQAGCCTGNNTNPSHGTRMTLRRYDLFVVSVAFTELTAARRALQAGNGDHLQACYRLKTDVPGNTWGAEAAAQGQVFIC